MIAMASSSVPSAQIPHTKQYVFVDEYNRHKRLKVMRACDGCRRRKIRCDGALQNGPWPCGACVRLKLKCNPPSFDQDNDSGPDTPDSTTSTAPYSLTSNSSFSTSSPSTGTLQWSVRTTAPTSAPQQVHRQSEMLHRAPREQKPDESLQQKSDAAFQPWSQPSMPTLQRAETTASGSSGGDPEEVQIALAELSSHMGELSVGANSIAPYIANHHKHAPQVSVIDEVVLPPDSQDNIPSEMMPHDDRAMDYFNYYFAYVHPYIPVLNKALFLEQWSLDRASISPLVLEAIFACTTQYLDQPQETKRWLALAAKHEEFYKDVPDLSTVQALIILMKAREFVQKPGYFYRSWMSLKYITTMAIDLGLHEHYQKRASQHSTSESLVRTRIWQVLFVLELYIGGPQGRSDMNVGAETVDMTTPSPADVDAFEYQTSRRMTALVQCAMNIKHSLTLMQSKSKTNRSWALDPEFASYDADLVSYMEKLSPDLQIHYPEDGRAPWLGGDHFVAGLHAYYHLVVIQHHRPQLQAKLEAKDPTFKQHLDICAHSAAMICRTHEALYRDFGLHGLLFMLRGINFTVYCVLTCTMLHLVAVTSPDPALNSQARDFFTRHMRILEYCMKTASPEMQVQINSLREAFSLDVNRPFELKPTLGGMRSPSAEKQHTPSTPDQDWIQQALPGASSPINEVPVPIMPFAPEDYTAPPQGYIPTMPDNYLPRHEVQSPAWDPSGIISQWHTAFGNPVAPPQTSPTEERIIQPGPTSMPMQTLVTPVYHNLSAMSEPAVTSMMWQDAFTNAYISGHKRNRDQAAFDGSIYGAGAKRRA